MNYPMLRVEAVLVVAILLGALLNGCSGCSNGSGRRQVANGRNSDQADAAGDRTAQAPRETRELEFTVSQDSSKAIPGSDGRLRLVLQDITGGRVRMAVVRAEGDSEISSTSSAAGDVLSFPFDGQKWQIRVKRLFNFVLDEDYGVFVVAYPAPPESGSGEKASDGVIDVMSFPEDLTVEKGESFKEWMKKQAWESEFGSPEFFFVRDGVLHLVSKPGPVYRDRYSLAIFNRQKLIQGMENKVLIRVAGGPDFRIDTSKFPFIKFKMTPTKLPGKDADLRDPDSNDCAFYLMVGFDTERHDFEGREMPETVAYVWANRKWEERVGKDSDYAEFLRYIPIGHGSDGLGKPREATRNLREDYRMAYPEQKEKPVPDVIRVGIMIDSNTVDSTAESALHWIRFLSKPSEPGK